MTEDDLVHEAANEMMKVDWEGHDGPTDADIASYYKMARAALAVFSRVHGKRSGRYAPPSA
jgi:hypothetical protein